MIRLRTVPYADPVAQELIAQVQQEYLQRYGETDQTPVEPGEFVPPAGLFLLASDSDLTGDSALTGDSDGVPVGCGGWRAHREGVAEIKRMYVVAAHRRRGVARAVLAELERTAARAGYRWLELFTGLGQPEAIAMYEAAGYRPVDGFGPYRNEPSARYLGKPVTLDGPGD